MQGIKDLFASERGIFAIILSLSSTAFVIAGKMTIEAWLTFNQVTGVALIASKTITTGAEIFKRPTASTLVVATATTSATNPSEVKP